jgi:site-specific DNA recombinase
MLTFDRYAQDLKDAVIYCRISSRAQEKNGMGLQSQETYCRQYAGWKE